MSIAAATTDTHCPYCALQCGMGLRAAEGPVPVTVVERPGFPVNRGALCGKGTNAAAVLAPGARLSTPLVRRGGELCPAGWDEALDLIAGRLAATAAAHGRDAVGVFGGGGLTNEKAYLLGKFARVVLRTSTIDYNGRFCMSSAAAAGLRAFGLDRGLPFPVADIPQAGCVILVGANPAETMPPFVRYLRELRENGGTLIVVDPRRTRTAELADLHLAPRPGTDLALALGLLHLVVADGRTDEEFIAARTTGWEETRAAAMAHWPEHVEAVTGVPLPQLREAAALFCDAATAMVLTARGPEQQAKGTDTVSAWINLCLATGNAGRPNAGYGCLTGQGNGQGGREHGQKADQLPGYRKLDDPAARAHVAAVWGVDPRDLPGPGRSAYELLDSLGGEVRSLLLMGSNPVVSAPHAGHVGERLRALDFLAVSDVVLSETAAIADVVLPVTQWAEETGTMTNLEGRVVLRRKAVDAPGACAATWRCCTRWPPGSATARGSRPTPRRSSTSCAVPRPAGPPTTRASATSGSRPRRACSGRARAPGTPAPPALPGPLRHPGRPGPLHPVQHRPAAEEPDAQYPVRLTTGRVLAQYQSGAQTRRVDALNAAAPGPFVELHPLLAERLGVRDGDQVAVVSRRGRTVTPARLTAAIRPDTVFMPFHWGGAGSANVHTNPALDPVSRMPEFKACAVRLEPV